jgi:radical SAM superfamily enzyme YgiQ (UPF0313 family)
MPNALLVYPKFPMTFCGYQYALDILDKKACMPPLGLLTVAGMFPATYRLKVVDMNVTPLTNDHLQWADAVFTSTMIAQKASLEEVVERSHRFNLPVVAGGPYPTSCFEEIKGVNHFVLGEVEHTFAGFLNDLESGTAQEVYPAPAKPKVTQTTLPRYDLIDIRDYYAMALQFSRGCPFDCEFCDITKLYGRIPRTKSNEQVLAEFDLLYSLGWRGWLFLVDDNFIGNKREAMRLLPHIAEWQRERNYPYKLFTETTVNVAAYDDLLSAMAQAGFLQTFLGIESPSRKALVKAKKTQNTHRQDKEFLSNAVRKIQAKGIQVTGGFILGLDGENDDVFDSQIDFIQGAAIPVAMVGLLSPLKGTDLYKRLKSEGRLLAESGGNNVSLSLTFEPEMEPAQLIDGYKRVLATIYDPTLKNYFDRCLRMLRHVKCPGLHKDKITFDMLRVFTRSISRQLFSRYGVAYLKFLGTVLLQQPNRFIEAVQLAILGHHFQMISRQLIAVDEFHTLLDEQGRLFETRLRDAQDFGNVLTFDTTNLAQSILRYTAAKFDEIDDRFREYTVEEYQRFKSLICRHLNGTVEQLATRPHELRNDAP